MLPLFDDQPAFLRERLAGKLAKLAREGIYIGTSSWKYEGWCGQIYTRERYLTRGKFAQKRFEAECLAEYSEVFPIVCGDFSYYQFPAAGRWKRLIESAGPGLLFSFKAPEEITAKTFPSHPRYGPRAAAANATFLDANVFGQNFLDPLRPYAGRIAAIILEFPAFSRAAFEDAGAFVARLDPFLAKLPRCFQYSVEVRNPEFLEQEYFGCLRSHGVSHAFNAWTRMPELERQIRIRDAWTADFFVTRGLLAFGRPYEDAVERFAPYTHVQEKNLGARRAVREMIRRAKEERRRAYIFVNNRLEGNAPGTIEAILEDDDE